MSADKTPATIAEFETTLASLIVVADRLSDHVLTAYLTQAREHLINKYYGRLTQ